MSLLLTRRRVKPTTTAFSPLDIAWHTSFWAEGPEFVALSVADGGAVATLPDETNANDATQATGSNQPTYRASAAAFNNKPVIEFDGTADFLQTASFTALSQPNEIVLVGRWRSGGAVAVRSFCDGILTTNRHQIAVSAADLWAIAAGTTVASGAADTTAHLFDAVFDATDTLAIDGTATISGNANTHTLTGVTLGSRFDGTAGFLPCDIAFYGLSDGTLSAGERSSLRSWAQSHYGTA